MSASGYQNMYTAPAKIDGVVELAAADAARRAGLAAGAHRKGRTVARKRDRAEAVALVGVGRLDIGLLAPHRAAAREHVDRPRRRSGVVGLVATDADEVEIEAEIASPRGAVRERP